MTVEELIQELEKLPKYLDVVILEESEFVNIRINRIKVSEDNVDGVHVITLTKGKL